MDGRQRSDARRRYLINNNGNSVPCPDSAVGRRILHKSKPRCFDDQHGAHPPRFVVRDRTVVGLVLGRLISGHQANRAETPAGRIAQRGPRNTADGRTSCGEPAPGESGAACSAFGSPPKSPSPLKLVFASENRVSAATLPGEDPVRAIIKCEREAKGDHPSRKPNQPLPPCGRPTSGRIIRIHAGQSHGFIRDAEVARCFSTVATRPSGRSTNSSSATRSPSS